MGYTEYDNHYSSMACVASTALSTFFANKDTNKAHTNK